MTTQTNSIPFTITEFRDTFQMFDAETYPDPMVQFYSELAALNINKNVWGRMYKYGTMLFTAHYLAISNNAEISGSGNGYGGGGVKSGESQSVGSASYSDSYDTSFYAKAGDLAETEWGRILYRYMRMFGAGGGVGWNSRQQSLTNWQVK